MKAISKNDTIQIESNNICFNNCSNCTRFCSLIKKPYFMDFDLFRMCVDSLEDTACMVGLTGGEPLLTPNFEQMCTYLRLKFPKKQLGLWTTFPKGYEHYREIICETFYHVFLNDHTRSDIMHHPFLVSSREVLKDNDKLWNLADECQFQYSWSASLSPRGAFACEMMSCLSILFDYGYGWKIEKGWWKRTPKDYKEQIETFCPLCGGCVPLRRRQSIEKKTDISPGNYELLKGKIRNENSLVIHNLKMECDTRPLAMYKDLQYRERIANRYGIFLLINENEFWTPYLRKEFKAKE